MTARGFAEFLAGRARSAGKNRKARYRPIGMDERVDLRKLGPDAGFVTVPAGVDGARLNPETLEIEILRGDDVVETVAHTGEALKERLRQIECGMDRRRFKAFRRSLDSVLRQYEFVLGRDAWFKRVRPEIDALPQWEAAGLTLQRPGKSALTDIRDALAAGRVAASKDILADLLSCFSEDAEGGPPQAFVIEHDWAAAFQDAEDIAEGEVRTPYDATLFEFAVSGRRACALVTGEESTLMVSIEGGWIAGLSRMRDFGDALISLMEAQMRAVCIALDAGVAVRDTVRADVALNRARARRGKPAVLDYHVVRLSRRERAAPLPRDGERDGPPGARRRLHFVRGHWRRYGGHKTWINWHLRGDPDLGFIDKHYAL